MAIGGSITATTQAVARYTPSNRRPLSQPGRPTLAPKVSNTGCIVSMSSAARRPEGTLAPEIVIQNTAASMNSMTGKPSQRFVRSRSRARSRSNFAFLRPTALERAAISCAAS